MTGAVAALLSEIDANAVRARSLVLGMSNEQFNWQPEPGGWSMGQCLAHLNRVNGPDLEPIRASIESGYAHKLTGAGPPAYGFISRRFVASMEPPAIRKFKAPKSYQPAPMSEPYATLNEYLRISAEIRRLVESADGLDLGRVKTILPALPAPLRAIIRMPLGARFSLLTAHDRRHLWQAEQVRKRPGFPVI